jgi:hypothetical protein
MAFMTLALVQVFHAFNARSQRRSAFTARLFTNGWLWAAVATCLLLQVAAVHTPVLQTVLHTTPLTAADWGVVLGLSVSPIGEKRGACGIVGGRRAGRRSGSRATAVSPWHVLAACVASFVIAAGLCGVCVQNGSGRLRASPGAPPPASHAVGPLVARAAASAPRSSPDRQLGYDPPKR